MKVVDLTGQIFGRWTVLQRAEEHHHGKAHWRCRCTCGVEKVVLGGNLIRGKSISCGCFKDEKLAAKLTTHGDLRGGKLTPEYRTWLNIIQRCHNPKNTYFRIYGGRGIAVCDRWLSSFENFLADMGRRPSGAASIDRINNDDGYKPGNCRWATPLQQARNNRRNRHLTAFGEKKTMAEWAADPRCRTTYDGLRLRLKNGLPIGKALTKPPRGQR